MMFRDIGTLFGCRVVDVEASVGHLSVVLEGRSQADTARLYEVSESTVPRWVARYRIEGDAAFYCGRGDRTGRRHVLADVVIDMIVNLRDALTAEGLDAGPATIVLAHVRPETSSLSVGEQVITVVGPLDPRPLSIDGL